MEVNRDGIILLALNPDLTWKDTSSEIIFYFPQQASGTVLRGVGAHVARQLIPLLHAGAVASDRLARTPTGLDEKSMHALLGALQEKRILVPASAVQTRAVARSAFTRAVLVGPESLVSSISSRARDGSVPVTALPAAGDSFPTDALTRGDLLVFADDRLQIRRHRELNRILMARGVQFLSIRIAAAVVELGPLTIPGRSACFECFWTRLQADQPREAPLSSLGDMHAEFLKPSVSAAIHAIAAEHVFLELLRCTGDLRTPPATLGAIVVHDLKALSVIRRPLHEVPGCSACALADPWRPGAR